MSNFDCQKCGKEIIDSTNGYITGCRHWPMIKKPKKSSCEKSNRNQSTPLGQLKSNANDRWRT